MSAVDFVTLIPPRQARRSHGTPVQYTHPAAHTTSHNSPPRPHNNAAAQHHPTPTAVPQQRSKPPTAPVNATSTSTSTTSLDLPSCRSRAAAALTLVGTSCCPIQAFLGFCCREYCLLNTTTLTTCVPRLPAGAATLAAAAGPSPAVPGTLVGLAATAVSIGRLRAAWPTPAAAAAVAVVPQLALTFLERILRGFEGTGWAAHILKQGQDRTGQAGAGDSCKETCARAIACHLLRV
jgi:hypothetical protein